MPRCKTPDKLIGIGGGGSKVVYRFMSQEWILREVLETDEYNKNDPDTLNATVIDTATKDEEHDERTGELVDIEELVDEYGYSYADGYLTFDGPKLIPEEIPEGWGKEGDSLTDPGAINKLCDNQRLGSWWLDDKEREPLKALSGNDFGGGVQRRRSISKAMYHISNYTGADLTPTPDSEDEVAIVAALGGGTGSGMALDLAKNLERGDGVHLYGILPHSGEVANEQANAYAALSEIEFAQLTEEGMDSPFDTVTLIPHIKSLEDNDEAFEMAVVRTILAHQNGLQGENMAQQIVSGKTDAPEEHATFTLSVPYTIKYDIERRDEAEEAIDGLIGADGGDKLEELEKESDLYEVVRKYLRDSFPNSAKQVLEDKAKPKANLETEEGREKCHQLRQRVEENLLGTFLEANAFDISGMEDVVKQIKEQVDELKNEAGVIGAADDSEEIGDLEAARIFMVEDNAPEEIKRRLEDNLDYSPDDGLKYELVETVKKELENIAKLRDLWLATSVITPEHTEPELEPGQAKRIRKGLREGVLDPDVQSINGVIKNPKLKEQRQELEVEKNKLDNETESLEQFYQNVINELTTSINRGRDEVWEELETLAAINEHREDVLEAIKDLEGEIQDKVDQLNEIYAEGGLENVELAAERFNLEGMDTKGVKPLNDKLEKMGVSKIDIEAIEDEFNTLKEARRYHLQHNPSPIPKRGTYREEEFNGARGRLNDYFTVNPHRDQVDIEQEFSGKFVASINRGEKIEDKKSNLTGEKIPDSFLDEITDHSGSQGLIKHSHEDLNMQVPSSVSVDVEGVKSCLKSGLSETESESTEDIVNETVSIGSIKPEEPQKGFSGPEGTVAEKVHEAYLKPIEEKYEKKKEQLEKLDKDDSGLIDRLKILEGISSPRNVNAELPQAHRQGTAQETYGSSFASNYECIYEIEIENDNEIEAEDNPFLEYHSADPEDLAGNPDDIAESDVLENHEDTIIRGFANRPVSPNWEDDNEKVPITDLNPKGSGTRDEFEARDYEMRYRPVYMSRAFEHNDAGMTEKYEEVKGSIWEDSSDGDTYKAFSYDSGGPDELTMVMFIGGVFLDNISRLTEKDGYKDKYEEKYKRYDFIGAHHSIGLAASEDRNLEKNWKDLWEWTEEDAEKSDEIDTEQDDFGGYVYRDEVNGDMSGKFMDEILKRMERENGDPKEVLLSMYDCDAYLSTPQLNQ
jgi:hypothetical protein